MKMAALREANTGYERKWGMTFDEFARQCQKGALKEDAFSWDVEQDSWGWEQTVTLLNHYGLRADHPAHPAGLDRLVASHGQASNNIRTAPAAGRINHQQRVAVDGLLYPDENSLGGSGWEGQVAEKQDQ